MTNEIQSKTKCQNIVQCLFKGNSHKYKCYAYNVGSNYARLITYSSNLQFAVTDVDRKE